MTDFREKWFNRSLDQWLADVIREAHRDMISLHQIYGSLSDDFMIPKERLNQLLFYILKQILNSNIYPVIQKEGGLLSKDPIFTGSPEMVAQMIITMVEDDPELATFLSGIWLGTSRQ